MVDVATALRGINAARNEPQSRAVATKRLALGRRGSFMIRYARFQGIHGMAQRELLPRAVLGFLCTTTLRALDQRRVVKLGPQGKL